MSSRRSRRFEPRWAASSSFAPTTCAIVEPTSPGSRREASPTQKTPSGYSSATSAAAWAASRVLPEPPAPVKREEASPPVREQGAHLLQLALAPEEGRRRHGQVRLVERGERRKLLLAELVQALRRRQVLQPMEPEVAQRQTVRQLALDE